MADYPDNLNRGVRRVQDLSDLKFRVTKGPLSQFLCREITGIYRHLRVHMPQNNPPRNTPKRSIGYRDHVAIDIACFRIKIPEMCCLSGAREVTEEDLRR